jgi:hypothetical protein
MTFVKSLPRLLQEAQCALLCVDAFDTLLLRNPYRWSIAC